MSRIARAIFYALVSSAIGIMACQTAAACQVDEFYLTKEGAFAASSREALVAAIGFEQEGNKEKLADLIKRGTVLRLTDNVKVRVLERSFEIKALKIQFPDGADTYWVKDGSLKQMHCN